MLYLKNIKYCLLISLKAIVLALIICFIHPSEAKAQCTQTACDALMVNMTTCQTNNCCSWVCPPSSTQAGCCICTASGCSSPPPPPPLVCVPYIPLVLEGYGSGNFGSGTICNQQTITVNFNTPLVGDPIVTLRGWRLRFTNGDHHYGAGIVTIPTAATSRPRILCSGTCVQFQVVACLRDSNSDDSVAFEYWYSVGAWPRN